MHINTWNSKRFKKLAGVHQAKKILEEHFQFCETLHILKKNMINYLKQIARYSRAIKTHKEKLYNWNQYILGKLSQINILIHISKMLL